MKYNKIFFSLLISFSAHAAEVDPWCDYDMNKPLKRVQLDRAASFFISADPTGRFVGVISGGNYIYDLEEVNSSGKAVSTQVPGSYDPVFTPDGKYVTLPGGHFYDASNIRDKVKEKTTSINPYPIGNGSGSSDPYQSIGVLEETPEATKYFYTSDSRNNSSRSQLGYFIASVDHANKKITTEKSGSLCNNLEEGHTPMISNDGKYLSLLNPKTKSTQIFKVGKDGGDCKMVVDTGVPTGKVSFNFGTDKRKIAFHVDRNSTNVNWFSGLGGGITKDTYIMEFDVSKGDTEDEKWNIKGLQRLGIHNDDSSGSYYPRFRKDGTIVSVSVEKEKREVSGTERIETNYYLDVYDPSKGKTDKNYNAANLLDPYCEPGKLKDQLYGPLALAWLWKNVCSKNTNQDRLNDSLLITPYLNHKACNELVDKFWAEKENDFKKSSVLVDKFAPNNLTYSSKNTNIGQVENVFNANVLTLSPTELKKSCPKDYTKKEVKTQVTKLKQAIQVTPEQTLINKCGGCHDTTHPFGGIAFQNGHNVNINNSNGVNAKSARKAIYALWNTHKDQKRMPPDGSESLQKQDKKKITDYLMRFLSKQEKAAIKALIKKEGGN